jgi:hypothetical protein
LEKLATKFDHPENEGSKFLSTARINLLYTMYEPKDLHFSNTCSAV